MMVDAALAAVHFLSIFVIVGSLSAQAFLLRLPSTPAGFLQLRRADLFYGVAAMVLIAAGISRVMFGLKPWQFYLASHAFWGKMAVFILIGLVSIAPTLRFAAWAKAVKSDPGFTPAEADRIAVRRMVFIELHLLALMVLFAVLMARGLGG